MDEVDTAIVDLLQADARLTQAQIAKKVGLSQPAVAERIRKLEERGVITGYTARVDARSSARTSPPSSAWPSSTPSTSTGFAKKVMGLPEVLECHRVAGQDSYLLKVRTDEHADARPAPRGELRTIPGVTRTHTTIVLCVREGGDARPVHDRGRS